MERLASDVLAYTFDLGFNSNDALTDKIKLRIQPLRNITENESVQNSGAMARVVHTQASPPLE